MAAFDSLLRHERFAREGTPEVVIRVGGPPASKLLGQWLAGLPSDVEQLVVDRFATWFDPDRKAAFRLPVLPSIDSVAAAPREWLATWCAAEAVAQATFDAVLPPRGVPSDPATVRALTSAVPTGSTMFVSSSMPIRDIEWFGRPRTDVRVLANRGANGIDGVVSSAIGAAAARPGPVVAVLGDLAFLHDSSGLVGSARRGLDCTFVVTDNDGGAIFSFLAHRDELAPDRFELLFGTPQEADIPAIARAHGFRVVSITDTSELASAIGDFDVVHVRTDRDENVEVHRRVNDAVVAALG